MATTESERLAAALRAPDDAPITPLGPVKVGTNSGSFTVTLPIKTVRELGIEQGDRMETFYDPKSGGFCFLPREQ